MDTIVAKKKPARIGHLDRLRFAQDLLGRWPWPYDDGEAIYDAKIALATPHFNLRRRYVTSLAGQLACQPWAIERGLKLAPVGTHDLDTVVELMRDGREMPAAWDDDSAWDIWQVVYEKGCVKLAGRAALAEFFNLGEWDTGKVFELYLETERCDQRERVSHRLAALIRSVEAK